MNFTRFALVLTSILSFSAAMDAPSRLTTLTSEEVSRAIKYLEIANKVETENCPILEHFHSTHYSEVFEDEDLNIPVIVKKLVDSLDDCSSLLWSAVTMGDVSLELMSEIVAKSNNEASLTVALDYALRGLDFDKAYIIWQKRPELLENIKEMHSPALSYMPGLLRRFDEYVQKSQLKEKKFVLRKGRSQEGSILYGAPLEILEQHIFPQL